VAPLPQQASSAVDQASSLQAAAYVYVRAPPAAKGLSPVYRGPYQVIKRTPKYFILKLGGRFDAVTVDRLKPHLGGLTTPAAPPRRGRPPKVGISSAASSLVSTGGGSVKDRGVE
jgi:hypothetical protein